MDAAVELAKLFKARDNKSKIGVCKGRVVVAFPDFKIDLGSGIYATVDNSTVAECFSGKSVVVGDYVIVVAGENNSHFFIIDRVMLDVSE